MFFSYLHQMGELLAKLAHYVTACLSLKSTHSSDPSVIMLELDICGHGISKTQLNEVKIFNVMGQIEMWRGLTKLVLNHSR